MAQPGAEAEIPSPEQSAGGTALSLYRELWRLLRPSMQGNTAGIVAAYLFSLGRIAASVSAPYLLAVILDKALPDRNAGLFAMYAGWIVLSFLLLFLSSFLMTWCMGRTLERIFLDLRSRLVAAIMRKPASFFARHDTGDLITRVSTDTGSLSMTVFDYAFHNLHQLTFILVTIGFMLSWEWRLGLYTALTLPCYLLLMALFQKPLARAASSARDRLSAQNATLLDILSGMREISFYQQSQDSHRRFMGAAGEFTDATIRSVLIGEWSFNSMEFFARVVTLAPFLLGGYWILHGISSITIGQLIAYNLYLTYLAEMLQQSIYGITRLVQISPVFSRLYEVLDYPEEEPVSHGNVADIMESTRIEFRNVSFSRIDGKAVLKNFNLTIEPGEKVAVIGPSGAGKSTLIDLLIRHIEPDSGEILFDGKPIASYNRPLYLQHFGYVQQTPYIFRTTVRENIGAGWYGVPQEVIADAARRVRIHESIMQMPNGYDTGIGSRGVDLSGGQRQRIALARAMVRDPEILLLDEFTSALDSATESAILDDLFASFEKQTIICVTHSQAVAARFERLVRIEKL